MLWSGGVPFGDLPRQEPIARQRESQHCRHAAHAETDISQAGCARAEAVDIAEDHRESGQEQVQHTVNDGAGNREEDGDGRE